MAEYSFNITKSDSLVMQQYLNACRCSEYLGPEKSLLVAIFDDAVQEYKKYYRADDAEGKRRFYDVEKWVMHAGDWWIFSFDNICGLLGLDPEYFDVHSVRLNLNRCKKKPIHGGLRKWAALTILANGYFGRSRSLNG